MQALPHQYVVEAIAASMGTVELSSSGLTSMETEPPLQYGGSGRLWSPETLLVAAVADCYVLTFRAIARASKLDWSSLDCNVTGTLDRDGTTTRFTEFHLRVMLVVPEGTDKMMATRLLEKAELGCLITNSLSSSTGLEPSVKVSGAAE